MGNMSGSYGSHYTLRQSITQNSQNINNNTTNVTVRLYLGFDGSSYYAFTNSTSSGNMVIDGNTYNYSIPSISFSSGQAKEILLAEWNGDIKHNEDGKRDLSVSGYWNTGTSRIGSGNTSSFATLNTIPRASGISCTTANVGEPALITVSSASGSFTHDVWFDFGSLIAPYKILTNVSGGTYSWTIPEEFYAQMPNSKSKTGRIYCRTYSNGQEIGIKAADFTVTTNEEKCKPTLEATVKDINEATIALTGDENKFIKYRSTAQISISTSSKNSATIVSKKINNIVVTNDINNITNMETNIFDIMSTDSRGYSTLLTLNPETINYIPLSINAVVRRIQPTTGEVGITFTGNYFNGNFGITDNTLLIKWYYKESSSEEYILGGELTPVISDNTFSSDSEIVLGDFFDYQKSYNIKLEVIDKLTTLNPIYSISQGIPIFNWGKDFFNINGEFLINGIPYNGFVLYKNDTGSESSLILNDNVENYEEIEIQSYVVYVGAKVYANTGKIPVNSVGRIHLSNIFIGSTGLQVYNKRISITGKNVNSVSDRSSTSSGTTDGTYTYITKIIGYKK